MSWGLANPDDWLVKPDGSLAEDDYIAFEPILGAGEYRHFLAWCREVGILCRMSYDPYAPAHHLYWFKSKADAQRFRRRFALAVAKARTTITRTRLGWEA